jgi:CubicO group peptidase (beta-lactamase class C family)
MLIDTPIDSVHSQEVHGVLIARRGKLVLEEYFHGEHREKPHDTRSAAKSLTATLAGAAVRAGVPLDVSSPVYRVMNGGSFPPDLEPRKRALTVEHLLTMSSGLDCDDSNSSSAGNEDVMQEQTARADWYRYTLDLRAVRDPGAKAVYGSANPNLLGGVLAKASGRPLPELFHELLAEPLGIKRYHLNLSPTGDAYMGGGARLLPRDFMKFGQLMLNGGTWNGRPVLTPEWCRRAGSPLYELRGIHYGYLWWVIDFPHKGRTVRAFFAGGNGGQVVMGVPELELVVAFYGGNYSDPALYVPQRRYVPEYILPAVDAEVGLRK